MFPHTGTWTLNEFVLVGGDATSDNLPPRFSQIQYAWRSPALGIRSRSTPCSNRTPGTSPR
jgi:aminobenzoyl-glutamate utilization protein B